MGETRCQSLLVHRIPPTNRWRNRTSQPRNRTVFPVSFATSNKTIGLTSSPSPNSPTMSEPIAPRDNPHSKSGMVSNQSSFPRQLRHTPPCCGRSPQSSRSGPPRSLCGPTSCHRSHETQRDPCPHHRSYSEGQLVWLEGTNIKTTHPKVKLSPRRHGPFKIITTTATNSRLQLPKQWRIHPVFHNSLLTPYNETPEHGPNYTQPPPEIVEGEDEHYEVETILNARPTPNRRGIQYLVKWKGYPDSENTWIPASGMKHAVDLVHEYHRHHPRAQTSTRTRR
jgi:hypothetical protein